MAESFKNRRKHMRIYRHFILRYYFASDPSAKKEVSQINNISRGGINFSAAAPLKLGEALEIELKTPFLDENLCLQGVILECREKIPQIIYEVRLQFKDISQQAKDILAKVEQYAHKEG
ncbi:MAG: PilZ domain-containing protein [Candidatus Omnitrophica bacterium]|nr:PilZ domain-containing protein [Candidatus Omnitrophota bacterium]